MAVSPIEGAHNKTPHKTNTRTNTHPNEHPSELAALDGHVPQESYPCLSHLNHKPPLAGTTTRSASHRFAGGTA